MSQPPNETPNSNSGSSTGLTYKDAGVDIEAGAALVQRIAPAAKATRRPEMLSGLGGFAAMAELPSGYDTPVLVTGTDGVGTKLKLAIDYNRDGVGQDLVAMCVATCWWSVLKRSCFWITTPQANSMWTLPNASLTVLPTAVHWQAVRWPGQSTAEMPGFMATAGDLAGFSVGVVEKAKIIDGSKVSVGDKIIGLPSSGPPSNGYSLIRKVLETTGLVPDETLLDELLAPTRDLRQTGAQNVRERRRPRHGAHHRRRLLRKYIPEFSPPTTWPP